MKTKLVPWNHQQIPKFKQIRSYRTFIKLRPSDGCLQTFKIISNLKKKRKRTRSLGTNNKLRYPYNLGLTEPTSNSEIVMKVKATHRKGGRILMSRG